MHQPHYRDALTGEYVQPWTALHALKDYSDMAAHLESVPAARAVVNFSPVLIEQIEELADQVARHLASGRELPDPVLAALSDVPFPEHRDRRLELLQSLLRAQRRQVIEPLPIYLELHDLAQSLATPERIAYASDELLIDLAVWYHIGWIGETIRRTDPRVGLLMERGRDFRLEDRRRLLELIGETLASILPRYRTLADSGRCELAISPYSHPILPLLCSFGSARESIPDAPLPAHPEYPGGRSRAHWHMEEAVRVFTRVFGTRPRGCWPSEGAVSEEALAIIDAQGFEWIATGGGVLGGSLEASQIARSADALDRPYVLAGQRVAAWFRDDELSDLIGFTYSNWHGDDAVADLMHRLVSRAQSLGQAGAEHAVLIALDGENAWEHYPQNGYHFLRALYETLGAHPALELTTLGALSDRGLAKRTMPRLRAGSWVHATLATWIGDADKNAAWDLLCEAKEAYDDTIARGTLAPKALEALSRQLALCEGSDWFWWFGDYNPADAVGQFDRLYRRQLAVLYRLMGREPPATLDHPLSHGGGSLEHGGVMRRAGPA